MVATLNPRDRWGEEHKNANCCPRAIEKKQPEKK